MFSMSFSVGGSIFWSGTSHRWRRLRRGGNGSSTSRWACYIGSMIERTGHCLCGAVRFRLSAEPLATRVCWCRDCQHLSANGLANLLVPTAALEISGQVREFVRTAQSGNKIQQRFCPTCGSPLFANSSARPEVTAVRAGSLDDPSSVRPTTNIWSGSAPAWACLDPKLERFEQQPPPPSAAPRT